MPDPTRTRTAGDPATASLNAAGTTAPGVSPGTASLPPPVVPGYDLGDEIGRGGMGVVYRARDLGIGREVAVKLLQDRFPAGSATAARFVDEARITGQLQHPGIPAVYQVGTLPDGRPFLAMKLIKGDTLDDLLKSGPVNTLAVFEGLCQAVGYAHAHGVIHRDLKPANVMVGAFGEVQVMDWGLAKVLASGGRQPPGAPEDPDATAGPTEIRSARDSDTPYTQYGSVMGTPAYMAPEQAGGETDKIDRRSDVFGLGAVLCRLLTGRPPFDGATADEVRLNAVRGNTTAALARLDDCRAEPGLVALCKACLAFDPAGRPADGNAVASAVAELRTAAEARAKQAELDKATAEVQAAEQRKRQRVVQWAGGAVAAVLLAGVIGTAVGLVEARKQEAEATRQAGIARDEATEKERQRGIAETNEKAATAAKEEEARQRAKAEKAEADTLASYRAATDETIGQLIGSKPVLSRLEKAYLENMLKRWQAFADRKGDDERSQFIRAEGHFHVARIWARLGEREAARREFEAARTRLQELVNAQPDASGYQQNLATTHNYLGKELVDLGKWEAAKREFEAARDLQQKLVDAFPAESLYQRDLVDTRHALGNLYRMLRDWEAARREFETARSLSKKLIDADPANPLYQQHLAATHHDHGILFGLLRDREAQRREQEAALALQKKLAETYPDEPLYQRDLANSHNSIGIILVDLQEWEAAKREYETALALQKKLVDAFHAMPDYQSELAATHYNLGNLFRHLKEWEGAKREHLTARTLRQKLADAYPAVTEYQYRLATTHWDLGDLYFDLREMEAAKREYEAARSLHKRLVDAYPGEAEHQESLANRHNSLGIRFYSVREMDAARREYQAAFEIRKKLADAHPAVTKYQRDLGGSYCNFGRLVRDEGQPADSLKWFDLAVQTLLRVHEKEPRDVTTTQFLRNSHFSRAGANTLLGNHAVAADDWEKVVELSTPQDRAWANFQHGAALNRAGKRDEAEAAFDRALSLREQAVRDAKADGREARWQLALLLIDRGLLYLNTNRHERAVPWFGRAAEAFTEFSKTWPGADAANQLRWSYQNRAIALGRLGKHADAAADWERVLPFCVTPFDKAMARNGIAVAKIHSGMVAEALADAEKVASSKEATADDLYQMACVYAVASGKVAEKKAEYIDRAMALLQQAVRAGWTNHAHMKTDTDLAPLRGRDDFKKLLADLEAKFPPKRETLSPPRRE